MGLGVQSAFAEYMALDRAREGGRLTRRERARWCELKRLLNLHFQPELEARHEDRRDSIRVPTQRALRIVSSAASGAGWVTMLSRAGAFVATECSLEPGTPVDLIIRDEQRDIEFAVHAEVASQPRDHATESIAQPVSTAVSSGVGVRFTALSPEQRKALDELYERTARHAVGMR